MKLLFDFFPVVLFFVVYKMHDDPHQGFMVATAAIIVATAVQILIMWMRERRVEKMHVAVLAIVVVFGGITLALDDEIFLKWKPTVVNWLFGLVFLGSQFIGSKNIVRRLMESKVTLPEPVWTRLNASWVVFFAVCGALNLYVVYNFDTDTWVGLQAVRADGTDPGVRARPGGVHDAAPGAGRRCGAYRLTPGAVPRSHRIPAR